MTHPQLQTAAERIRVAEGYRVQAGLRPNPRLTLQSENTRFQGQPAFSFANDTDDFAYVSQIFEVGGKRARRLEYAQAGIAGAEAERALTARQIAARVSVAYWSAAAANGLRDLLEQNVTTFDRIVEYHRNRVNEGAMAEVDLMRVLLERDRILVTARNAAHTAEQARIALQREMGQTEFPAIRLADSLTEIRDLPLPDLPAILSLRPETALAREAILQAQSNLRLQHAAWVPDPEAFLGYKRATGFNTLIGGLNISLPFLNRNQGLIASAGASVRVAESHLRESEVLIRSEVEAAWTTYLSRRKLVTETLAPMRERAEEISRIALAAYREGGIDLLRLLDAERARLEALTAYYQALADYQTSVTHLQIVTGAPL